MIAQETDRSIQRRSDESEENKSDTRSDKSDVVNNDDNNRDSTDNEERDAGVAVNDDEKEETENISTDKPSESERRPSDSHEKNDLKQNDNNTEDEIMVEDDFVYDEEPTIETDEERRAKELFNQAMIYLNQTRPDKRKAYILLQQAAQLNHSKSQELVGLAHLFGDQLPINLETAKKYFQNLAQIGNPVAQMVSKYLVFK